MAKVDPGVYRDILRVREAYAFDIGAFLMRFYTYMMTIGTVTMLTLSGYSFFTAGLVSSTIALSTFVVSPRISKLVDERGQSRVVPFAAAITCAGLALMLVNIGTGGPVAVTFPAAVLMGFVPNPQALARARWTYLIRVGRLGANAPQLRTMFSYEGVLDDVAFMFGPSMSVTLAATFTPIAGLLTGGIAFAVGAAMVTLSRSTEPEPGWDKKVESAAGATLAQSSPRKPSRKSIIRTSPIVRVLFALMMFVGGFYGVFDTTTVSLAEDLGNPNFASICLIVSAIVSMLMGFVFGMIDLRRVPQHIQLVATAVCIGCAYGTMALIDSAISLFAVSAVAALAYAPFVITANATCERSVPGERITEAITWLNAGMTCGMAFGPTLGGAVIDAFGSVASFDAGALLALAIPVTALARFRIIKRNVRNEAYVNVAKDPSA